MVIGSDSSVKGQGELPWKTSSENRLVATIDMPGISRCQHRCSSSQWWAGLGLGAATTDNVHCCVLLCHYPEWAAPWFEGLDWEGTAGQPSDDPFWGLQQEPLPPSPWYHGPHGLWDQVQCMEVPQRCSKRPHRTCSLPTFWILHPAVPNARLSRISWEKVKLPVISWRRKSYEVMLI